jgi:non-homologous end joining protein Ku
MNKIQEALNIIKKFHPAFHVQKTDVEEIVFLFEYKMNKKTVGSEKIKNAVEKAVKQQDFPKTVKYQDGMLFVLKPETVKEIKQEEKIEEKEAVVEETVNEEIAVEDAPKKRTRKKKETETETESE